MLSTNKQTDKPTLPKHNLLCQVGNKVCVFIYALATKYPQTFIIFQAFGDRKPCQGQILIQIATKL